MTPPQRLKLRPMLRRVKARLIQQTLGLLKEEEGAFPFVDAVLLAPPSIPGSQDIAQARRTSAVPTKYIKIADAPEVQRSSLNARQPVLLNGPAQDSRSPALIESETK
jgi:hypothetical protein